LKEFDNKKHKETNMLFKHYILTRFNLVSESSYNTTIDYVNSDEFLSPRFSLFETYCFPSVKQQSNNNFTWFVLFNDQLPEKWRNKLDKYKQQFPNFEARFMSAEETKSTNWHATLNRFVLKELNESGNNTEFILTTRFDNDDAIHLSFVDAVQKYFLKHQEETILNYPNGLQYIPQYNVLKNTTYPKSHFSTLIMKKTKDLKTALSFSHTELPNSFKTIFLKPKKRMWLEIIHSHNVVNTVFFQFRNLPNDLFFVGFKYRNLKEFGIEQNIPRFNFGNLQLFFKWFSGKCREKTISK